MARSASKPLEARLAALYAMPPAQFTAARKALAAALTAARDPRAAEVERLPRPTLAVWSLNLLAQEAPQTVEALLRASQAVVAANREVLGGARGGALIGANHALQEALNAAVATASERAAARGHPLAPAMAGRARTTLRALALGDSQARETLRAGRVQTELATTGLEAFQALAHGRAGKRRASPPPGPGAPPHDAPHRTARQRAAELRRAEAARALANAQKRLKIAMAALRAAEAAAHRQRTALERAQRRATEAAARAHQAEQRAAQARLQAGAARRAVETLGKVSTMP